MKRSTLLFCTLALTLTLVLSGCDGSPAGGGSTDPSNPNSGHVSTSGGDLECSTKYAASTVQKCFETRSTDERAQVESRINLWGTGLAELLCRSDVFPKELLSTQEFVNEFRLNRNNIECLTQSLCQN